MEAKFTANYSLLKRTFYALFFLAVPSASFLDDQPYCAMRYRRLCQGKGQHVACVYPNPGPGASCENYTQITFTPEMRHFIVNYINKRRQKIAAGTERVRGGALIPKPQIMMMVVWNRELAYLAQRLADQCSFIHDDCRATVRYPYAGQTVGEVRWRSSRESDASSARRALRRVLDAWWGERRRVRPQQLVTPFKLASKGAAWGHFSQLAVWALTAAGCGAARHGTPRRLLLVCDFSHTNMLGQPTLDPGPLAPCPVHYARRSRSPYPLLCAPIKKPEVDEEQIDDNVEGGYEQYPAASDEEDIPNYSEMNTQRNRLTVEENYEVDINVTENYKLQNLFKNITIPQVIHKIEQELDTKSVLQYEQTQHSQRTTTRLYFGNIRENHENDHISKARFKIQKDDTHYHIPGEMTTEVTRQKWKYTRQRPRRPGADALMVKPVEKVLRRSSIASMTLDHEDMEQLFRDTGFHKHWRKQ